MSSPLPNVPAPPSLDLPQTPLPHSPGPAPLPHLSVGKGGLPHPRLPFKMRGSGSTRPPIGRTAHPPAAPSGATAQPAQARPTAPIISIATRQPVTTPEPRQPGQGRYIRAQQLHDSMRDVFGDQVMGAMAGSPHEAKELLRRWGRVKGREFTSRYHSYGMSGIKLDVDEADAKQGRSYKRMPPEPKTVDVNGTAVHFDPEQADASAESDEAAVARLARLRENIRKVRRTDQGESQGETV